MQIPRPEINLYQLFREIAGTGGVEFVDDPVSGFCCIKNEGFAWPNVSFIDQDGKEQYSFNIFIAKIREGVFPRLFIFNEDRLEAPLFKESLAAGRFMPADRWVNMTLNLETYIAADRTNDLIEIEEPDLVNEWTETLSLGLFGNKKLDNELFRDGMIRGRFRLFARKVENKIVATTMVYTDGSVPGIYMVSTHPEYRKKGYGYEVMNFTLSRLKEEGSPEVVLQSTQAGLPLYTRMGFDSNAALSLYYCLIK